MRTCLLTMAALSLSLGTVAYSQTLSTDPSLQQRTQHYRIGLDDVVTVNFALSPELNQNEPVQPDGFINLVTTHSVYVLGMTIPEAQAAIKAAYVNILHDPIIEIDVKDYQKPLFSVLGQVNHPGQFELRRDTTIMEGMAIAGGLNPNSKTQVFLMRRVNGTNMLEVHKFDLKQVLNGKNINEQPHLQAGDIVVIPEKFITEFKKYVPYPGLGINPFQTPTY